MLGHEKVAPNPRERTGAYDQILLGSSDRMTIVAPIDRFTSKHSPHGDCWEWTAARHPSGYGKFFIEKRAGRTVLAYAHRWSHEHYIGPIPDGYEVDHLCRNKWCVNPAHLEAVLPVENKRRVPRPITCGKGHEFTPENTAYRTRRGVRTRDCRECRRERRQRQYEQHEAPSLVRRKTPWSCPACGVTVRTDGRKRHLATMHGDVDA